MDRQARLGERGLERFGRVRMVGHHHLAEVAHPGRRAFLGRKTPFRSNSSVWAAAFTNSPVGSAAGCMEGRVATRIDAATSRFARIMTAP